MALIISGILFACYLANVVIGSIAGNPVVGDVGEMLILIASVIAFVVAILSHERAEDSKNKS